MAVKTFADTSAVSLSYAFDNGYDGSEVTADTLAYVPFTTEGFKMSKDAKTSTAITSSRRISNSKNTQGTAEGATTAEMGVVDFIKDFFQAAMMNTWTADPGGVFSTITDGSVPQYMVWEKVIRPEVGATKKQSVEQYFGTLVNEATLDLGNEGDVATLALTMMSANAAYNETVQGADGLGGSLATSKTSPDDYELADSANNVTSIVVKDSGGTVIPMTFSTGSIKITNNVRTQGAVGSVFAAGMAMGKVAVEMTGTAYYYDQSVLKAHMENELMSVEMSIETAEGTYDITLPAVRAGAPDANAQSENSDYTSSITLTAQEGTVGSTKCAIHVKLTPTATP